MSSVIGRRLKRARKARGLTQARLAEMAKVNQVFISQLETGDILDPGASRLQRIEAALGLQPYELLGRRAS